MPDKPAIDKKIVEALAESHCLLYDASLFIGLYTLPLEGMEKFVGDMARYFHTYNRGYLDRFRGNIWGIKEECQKLAMKAKAEPNKYTAPHCLTDCGELTACPHVHYKPHQFYILGAFDAAVISLMDDFGVGLRFRASHSRWPWEGVFDDAQRAALRFWHKSMLGPMPQLNKDVTAEGLVRRVFEDGDPLPLVGICQLKLDSGLLLGTGADLVRCAIRAIQGKHKKEKEAKVCPDQPLRIVLLESTSWHEMTLLVFSNSYERILKFIAEVRELDIDAAETLCADAGHEADYMAFRQSGQVSLRDLLYAKNKPEGAPDGPLAPGDTHLFWSSATYLGFRMELMLKDPPAGLAPVHKKDSIFFSSRWSSKAGHLHTLHKDVVGFCDKIGDSHEAPGGPGAKRILLCTGRGDFVCPSGVFDPDEAYSSAQLVQYIRQTHVGADMETKLAPHALESNTNVIAAVIDGEKPNAALPEVKQHHYQTMQNNLAALLHEERIVYDVSRVRDLSDVFREGYVTQAEMLRVYNVFTLYNQGILDPALTRYFLDLRPLVQAIEAHLRDLCKKAPTTPDSIQAASDDLDRLVKFFEVGWRNRFHASWLPGDVTDFNFDFKGGVQQLCTAFNGAYGAMCKDLCPGHTPVAIVSGTAIKGTNATVELSYHDLFYPEFFAARAAHEAAETGLFSVRARAGGAEPEREVTEASRMSPAAIAKMLRENHAVAAPPAGRVEQSALAYEIAERTSQELDKTVGDMAELKLTSSPGYNPSALVEGLLRDVGHAKVWKKAKSAQRQLAAASVQELINRVRHDARESRAREGWMRPTYAVQFLERFFEAVNMDGPWSRFAASYRQQLPSYAGVLLHDVWADIVAFHYVYLADRPLYAYWQTATCLSDSRLWLPHQRGGRAAPNDVALHLALLRLATVMYGPLRRQASGLVEDDNVACTLKSLFGVGGYDDEVERVCDYVRRSLPGSPLSGVVEAGRWSGAPDGDGLYRRYVWLAFRYSAASARICKPDRSALDARDAMLKQMAQGQPPQYGRPEFGKRDAGMFIRLLCNAYLRLLRDGPPGVKSGPKGYDGEAGQVIYLPLTDKGRVAKDVLNARNSPFANLLFDVRGGTRARGDEFVAGYFKWRSAFTMSLWHMSMIAGSHELAVQLKLDLPRVR